jgi:hypothetical protein
MTRIQFLAGLIGILIFSYLGTATKLVTIGEVLILILFVLISLPFLLNLFKKTPNQND